MSPLKRRQFSQLAAASLTATVVTGLSSKTSAEVANLKIDLGREIIYGVNLLKENGQNRENRTPRLEVSAAEILPSKPIGILSKVITGGLSVDNLSPVKRETKAFAIPDFDRLTKTISLSTGGLLISTVSSTRMGNFSHLTVGAGGVMNLAFRGRKILDLERSDQTIESIVELPNNQLLALVGTEGIKPYSFQTIDLRTGRISKNKLDLPPLTPDHGFANLCRDPKSDIFYATEMTSEGIPILISMNLRDKAIVTGKVKINTIAPLSYRRRYIIGNVQDLNFSYTGQLYALASINGGKSYSLFVVDTKGGEMTMVREEFTAEKFAFAL